MQRYGQFATLTTSLHPQLCQTQYNEEETFKLVTSFGIIHRVQRKFYFIFLVTA